VACFRVCFPKMDVEPRHFLLRPPVVEHLPPFNRPLVYQSQKCRISVTINT
jgi:hypothetical protein